MNGIEIVIIRKQAGLKQYELAALLKTAAPILCEMEAGRRPISRYMKRKIQNVLKRVQSNDRKDT